MPNARNHPTPTVVRVGSLRDDVGLLAANVVRTLCDGPRCIWVEDDNRVYSGRPDGPKHIPQSWIVGTFSMGHPAAAIGEDLAAIATERSKNWILE
jgi:hypothetical protein